MLEIGSVRLVSNPRNCLPFFESPLTSVSELTNILSPTPPSDPPAAAAAADTSSSSRERERD